MAGEPEQLGMVMTSPTVTALTNPRDVVGSLREVYDSRGIEVFVTASETRSGSEIKSTDHRHDLSLSQTLTDRARFGQGPFKYDHVQFIGNRFYKMGEDIPLWENYDLIISDADIAVASLAVSISRIGKGNIEKQYFTYNGAKLSGYRGGVPEIRELDAYKRVLPVIRTALIIGETALIKSTPAVE